LVLDTTSIQRLASRRGGGLDDRPNGLGPFVKPAGSESPSQFWMHASRNNLMTRCLWGNEPSTDQDLLSISAVTAKSTLLLLF
jgi:hypothetical protein